MDWSKDPIMTVKILILVQWRKKSVVAFTLSLNIKYARKTARGLKKQIAWIEEVIISVINSRKGSCFSMMLLSFRGLL